MERPMHLFGQEVCARCWSIFLAPCKKHCDNCGHCDNSTGIGFARTQSPADRCRQNQNCPHILHIYGQCVG